MDDLISRHAAIDAICMEWCNIKRQDCKQPFDIEKDGYYWCDGCEIALRILPDLPSAHPEIIRCKDCKHNPKLEWFGCPMSHMSEKQRPETAWCWKGERKDNE